MGGDATDNRDNAGTTWRLLSLCLSRSHSWKAYAIAITSEGRLCFLNVEERVYKTSVCTKERDVYGL